MKLMIDTSEELNAEQLYGLYVAAKKKEKIIETESKSYKNGFDAGYAKCHRDYYFNQCVTYTSGKEDGYKEGYEKAKRELHDDNEKCRWLVKCRGTILPGKFNRRNAEQMAHTLSRLTGLIFFVIVGEE